MRHINLTYTKLFRSSRLGCYSVWFALLLLTAACARRPTGLGAQASFPVGTCVNLNKLRANPAYRATIEREFTSITAEDVMKMDSLQPRPNEFTWASADALLRFARQHHQRVHGHALVWSGALPKWVLQFKGDTAAWDQLLRQHITTTMHHFKGRVKAWDVVNEALENDDTFNRTIWYEHLGPGYVAHAFQYARQADPEALLFYNDFDLENGPSKLNGTLRLLARLKAQGIKVDGVGLQMHASLNVPFSSITEAFQKIAAQGYLVHVSEMDVQLNRYGQNDALTQPTPALLAEQRDYVRTVVAAYRKLPPAQQYGITFWGVSDGDTWLRSNPRHPEWPLLFDDKYQPKPAYEGFREGLTAPLTR